MLGVALAGGASAGRYTVRPGDTLGNIAARNHTTVAALAQANHITNPDHIVVGQSIMLSAKPAAATLPLQLIAGVAPFDAPLDARARGVQPDDHPPGRLVAERVLAQLSGDGRPELRCPWTARQGGIDLIVQGDEDLGGRPGRR